MPTKVTDSTFEIRVPGAIRNVSRVFTLPTGVQAVSRGIALMEHDSVDETTGEQSALLAQPNGTFLGFLVRGVRDETTDAGKLAILADQTYPRGDIPEASGNGVSIRSAEEIEVEGSEYILDSGARAIVAGTLNAGADDTGNRFTTFVDGKVALVISTERKEFVISKIMTPNTAGNVRLRLRKLGSA